MKRGKKSQSEVITTVLIILIVLAAVFIVYVVIRNMVKSGVESADVAPMNVPLMTSSTSLSSQVINVSVSRGAGNGEMIGVKIIFKNSDNAVACNYEDRTASMNELETRIYIINLTKINCAQVSSYDVYPIIKSGNREIFGLEASHSGSYSHIGAVIDCVVGEACDDGNSCTVNDACVSGVCSGTLITSCVSGDGCCASGCSYSGGDLDCPSDCVDADSDGYNITIGCGAIDCNDTNANINHLAAEVCDNVVDDNCNGLIDCGDNLCKNTYSCFVKQAVFYLPLDGNTTNLGTNPVTAIISNLGGVDKNKYSYIAGKKNQAINFITTDYNGNGDYITTKDVTDNCLFRNLNCGTKTISFWIKTTTSYGYVAGTMRSLSISPKPYGGWNIDVRGGGTYIYFNWINLGGYETGAESTVSVNTWTHFAIIVNNTNIKIYKNNILVKDQSGLGGFKDTEGYYSSNNLTIGAAYPIDWLYGYNGAIDEFFVFNRALTQSEINVLYDLV